MCFEKEYHQIKKENEKGIIEYIVDSWRGFCQLIYEEFKQKPRINDYVWRGHRCENWGLISSFDREFQKLCKEHCEKNDNLKKCRQYILKRHTNSFAYACRNKLGEFGIKMREFLEFTREKKGREKFWWALGQHYGMATPMLDWCCSPFVAAFFAFEEESKNQCQSAVWGLKFRDAFKEINNKIERMIGHHRFEYWDPMSAEYPRLVNQRGLFTLTKNGEDIKKLVQDKCENTNIQLLIKIKISNKNGNRESFLRGLDSMGINHITIYPDIFGAASFSNLGMEFNDYARFPGQGPKKRKKEICKSCKYWQ
jgi:hypothetical protein